MMAVRSLGYVRIGMRDPEEWARVGTDILGFTAATANDGSVRLRMDAAPFRYLIEVSESDTFVCAGWQYPSDRYGALLSTLAEQGIDAKEGDDDACSARAVAAFVSFKDPSGNTVEVFHTRDGGSDFLSPLNLNYVADDLGLGHVVLPALEHAATCEFYEKFLGFELSDELRLPPPMEGAPEMQINFYHAENPRHHSIACFNGPAPSGVVHLMTEYTTIDEVGECLDRVTQAGLPITASIGRHINDNMLSFYFLCPGGIPMEVGYDGEHFDWNVTKPTYSTAGDHWGHEYNFPGIIDDG